ncbi:MAG: hypothetical protein OEY89_03315 [Gammaproteobacteria bacterium]|nr:hypothetical protein [Gammaproteobacteria bacterium]
MKVIVHFGFPKTMSSTLQFGVFKPLHMQGLLNLKTWRLEDENENLDRRPSSRLFMGKEILDEYLDFQDNAVNILSDESFTAPWKLRRNNYGDNIADPFSFPEKIKSQIMRKYGDEVEFIPLIMIRNQADLIFSQYVEEYNLKKYKGVDLLFDDEGRIEMQGFEIYRFYEYFQTLESVFGVGKTKLFLFEDWKYNFSACCCKLANQIGVAPQVIEDMLSKSHVNKKMKNTEGYFTKGGEDFIYFLSEDQKNEIRKYFEQDNVLLQKHFGEEFDLDKYKYL